MEGLRVIRGPDWQWGQQDGGEGYVGTVTLMEEVEEGNPAVVQWDCAGRCKYRCGADGKYDLRVLDTAPTGVTHPRLTCTWCDESPLIGTVWKCVYCYDYYLCTTCYMGDRHSLDHPFHRCLTTDLKKRVRVPPRFLATKLPVMGMFPGSKVTRGPDWQWHNQDGGRDNHGQVTKIQGWKTETFRSVVEVMWNGARASNVYRRAHRGKVDLKCVGATERGSCYIDHLALLGYQYPDQESEMAAGDTVIILVDPDIFKAAQEDHGGWNDHMAEFIGQVAVINRIRSNEETVIIRFSSGSILLVNRNVLTKIDVPIYNFGDIVRIRDDMVQVFALQDDHGGWNDDMALTLGQLGQVLNVQLSGDVMVKVNGQRWRFNPQCLVPAPGEVLPEIDESIGYDPTLQQQLYAMAKSQLPSTVPAAAVLGDIKTLQSHLEKRPQDVNYQKNGNGALHIAITRGFLPVLKTAIQFNANLETKSEEGVRPVHLCALLNDAEAAKLLVSAGADVNVVDSSGNMPIHLACHLGHSRVLEELVKSPLVNLNSHGGNGRSALDEAVFVHQRGCVRVLLEHGADPTQCDLQSFEVIHNTAGFGFVAGVEEILRYYPQYINRKKKDGFTALHVATVNKHADFIAYLASHPACNINILNHSGFTPLHVAAMDSCIAELEQLVGYGANLNVTIPIGDTVLHMLLGCKSNMPSPSNNTPHIKKIQDEIETNHGKGVLSADMIVCLFLVANGADIHIKNLQGQSPLSMCPRDCTKIFNTYAERHDKFHGSLKGLTKTFADVTPKPVKQRRATEDATPPRRRTDTQVPSPAPSSSPHTFKRSYSSPPDPSMKTGNGSGQAVTPPPKANGHLGSITKEAIKEENVMNNLLESVEITEKAPDILECFLCESGADIKLMPCGHVNMCHSCRRPKKCPECRTAVAECVVVCVLCQSETVSKTLQPCGHTYCSGCGSDLKYCKACKDDQK